MSFRYDHERWAGKNKNENSHGVLPGTIVLGFV